MKVETTHCLYIYPRVYSVTLLHSTLQACFVRSFTSSLLSSQVKCERVWSGQQGTCVCVCVCVCVYICIIYSMAFYDLVYWSSSQKCLANIHTSLILQGLSLARKCNCDVLLRCPCVLTFCFFSLSTYLTSIHFENESFET